MLLDANVTPLLKVPPSTLSGPTNRAQDDEYCCFVVPVMAVDGDL